MRLYYVAQQPSGDARITELHHGTFRGQHRVISAELQRQGERHFAPAFRRYVELAKRFAPPANGSTSDAAQARSSRSARAQGIADIDGIELSAERLVLAVASSTGPPYTIARSNRCRWSRARSRRSR
jgi:hypothetical protein